MGTVMRCFSIFKKEVSFLGSFLSLIAGILADFIPTLHCEIDSIIFFVIACFFMLTYIWKLSFFERKLERIKLMAEYGHLHTLRMMVLRDLSVERSKTNIEQENRFTSLKSEFSFCIKASSSNKSSVIYHYKLDITPSNRLRIKDTEKFVPWIFGEDRKIPKQCMIKEDNGDWEFASIQPVIIETNTRDVITDDIYKVIFSEWRMSPNEVKHVELKYIRRNVFSWDKKRVRLFIIWPKCFVEKIKGGTKFEVIFEGTVKRQVQIYINVYDCKAKFVRYESPIRLTLDRDKSNDNITVYSKENVVMDADSVYALYIK